VYEELFTIDSLFSAGTCIRWICQKPGIPFVPEMKILPEKESGGVFYPGLEKEQTGGRLTKFLLWRKRSL
jgi:hypothetical protein